MSVELFDMSQTTVDNPTVEADVRSIRRLWLEIGGVEPPVDIETSRMLMEGLEYHVVRDPDELIVGAVSVMDCGDGLAKLDSLAVTPEHQGKGYGTKLAKAAITHAFQNGCKKMLTHAVPASQRIFASLGFEDIEAHDSGDVTMIIAK